MSEDKDRKNAADLAKLLRFLLAAGEVIIGGEEGILAAGDRRQPARPEILKEAVRLGLVRRHGDRIEEAGVFDLVQCLLGMRFGGLAKNKLHWDNVALEITHSLLEDPPSDERLRRFWTRLYEAAG